MAAARSERATVDDVARLAGVSAGTVSKALNGTGQLRPATRQRVRDAADALGFVRNGVGRSLASGRTHLVGLLTGDSIGRFSIPLMLGAENALAAADILVLLCDSRDDPIREAHYLRALVGQRVEGIIITGRRTEARPSVDVPVPVVYAFAASQDDGDASVIGDDALGARRVHAHLTALGRTRLVHVTGPADHRSALVRADATAAAAAAAGVPLVRAPMFGEWSEEWGRAAADALLGRDGPDAITCGNDMIARGVVTRLRERGVRVPADVAVTGFDNWDVMVEGARPRLTSVDLELGAIGRRAGELLLDAIDGRPHAGVELMPPRLVPRASTLGSD